MIEITTEQGALVVNGRPVSTRFPVKEAHVVNDVVVAILDVPATQSMTENVVGLGATGAVLWTIQRIPQTSTDPTNCYTCVSSIDAEANKMSISNWNGDNVTIDVATGMVTGWKFLK